MQNYVLILLNTTNNPLNHPKKPINIFREKLAKSSLQHMQISDQCGFLNVWSFFGYTNKQRMLRNRRHFICDNKIIIQRKQQAMCLKQGKKQKTAFAYFPFLRHLIGFRIVHLLDAFQYLDQFSLFWSLAFLFSTCRY